jgi:hypothetical protein
MKHVWIRCKILLSIKIFHFIYMCFFNVLCTQHLSPKSTNLSKIQIMTIIAKLRPTKFVMLTHQSHVFIGLWCQCKIKWLNTWQYHFRLNHVKNKMWLEVCKKMELPKSKLEQTMGSILHSVFGGPLEKVIRIFEKNIQFEFY